MSAPTPEDAAFALAQDAFTLPNDARVDAHVSVWRDAPPEARMHPFFPGEDRAYLPEHLGPILQRSRFDAAIVVSTGTSEAERAVLASWINEAPCLWGLVAGWSEDLPNSQAITTLQAKGQLLGTWAPIPSVDSAGNLPWRDAASWCARRGLPLELSAPPSGCDFASLRTIAAEADVPLVLADLGGAPADNAGLTQWMEAMRLVAANRRTYVKLSSLYSSPTRSWSVSQLSALFQFLLDTFGPERLMFGSGWPYCLPAHAWKECLARFTQALGPRDQTMRELMMGATARQFYGGLER